MLPITTPPSSSSSNVPPISILSGAESSSAAAFIATATPQVTTTTAAAGGLKSTAPAAVASSSITQGPTSRTKTASSGSKQHDDLVVADSPVQPSSTKTGAPSAGPSRRFLILFVMLAFAAVMTITFMHTHWALTKEDDRRAKRDHQQEEIVHGHEHEHEGDEGDANDAGTAEQVEKPPTTTTTTTPPSPAENDVDDDETKMRRQRVVDAMKHAWSGYVQYAWGKDELLPRSHTGKNWVDGGMAMTIVDALDTLWIMGLKDEFSKGAEYVKKQLQPFNQPQTMTSVFETTIRMLGGLLSAYDLSGDKGLLDRAKEMGDVLMPAFKTTTGVPYAQLNFRTGAGANPGWTGNNAILAEFATLQLEFRRLTQLTGDAKYDQAVTKVMDIMEKNQRDDGLYPTFFSTTSGNFVGDHFTFGALADSAYEYFLKQWLLTGKTEKRYLDMYRRAMNEGLLKKLIEHSKPSEWTYIAEMRGGSLMYKMDHLACFAGGMLALGAQQGACLDKEECAKHLKYGEEITRTCVETYRKTATGVGPETIEFRTGVDFQPGVPSYILRPEAIESVFYMWRITGDQKWRDFGWAMFEAIDKYCKVPGGGYSGIRNVNTASNGPDNQDDTMQSFFLAETLKYFYLLFAPKSTIPLDQWVFNTEAHPVKITRK